MTVGEISERTQRVHKEAIVVDMCENIYSTRDVKFFETLIDAGITAIQATIPDDWDDLVPAITKTAKFYELVKGARNVRIASTATDIQKAKEEGKVAIIMGIQNPLPIERNLALTRVFRMLGFRVIQLAYYQQNYLGAGCVEQVDNGLTDRGREAIEELNRLGILIDVSHCGDKTSIDAAQVSKDPIVVTHGTPAGLVELRRARSDDAIKAIAEKGGVIGQGILTSFCEKRDKMGMRATLSDFVDMIDYIVNLVGIDHVGLGTDLLPFWKREDYDSVMKGYARSLLHPHEPPPYEERWVEGFDGVADTIRITEELLRHGYSDDETKKILGGNWLRVMRDVCK